MADAIRAVRASMRTMAMAACLAGGTSNAMAQRWEQEDLLPGIDFRVLMRGLFRMGYRPYVVIPRDRSDLWLNDTNENPIRRRFPSLISCTGVDLNRCNFLLVRPGQTVVDIGTTGEAPNDLAIETIDRLNSEQADRVVHDGCDLGPARNTPCPR